MSHQAPRRPHRQPPGQPPRESDPPGPDGACQPHGQPSDDTPPQSPDDLAARPPAAAPPRPPADLPSRRSKRHRDRNVLFVIGGSVVLAIVVAVIASHASLSTKTVPGPTVTDIEHEPGPTVTATVSVTPTANAQGQATQISASGVYVVGQDIAAGTWHTAGDGGQTGNLCYYALLSSTNTSDIIDNNNFDGPETVSTSGADALEINGPCTWNLEG